MYRVHSNHTLKYLQTLNSQKTLKCFPMSIITDEYFHRVRIYPFVKLSAVREQFKYYDDY